MPKAVARAASNSATVLSVVISPEGGRGRLRKGPSIIFCEPRLCDQFDNERIYLSLKPVAILPHLGFRRRGKRDEA